MTYVSVDAKAVRDAIGGRVYVAGESGYEPARLPWQRRLDPRPALIVEAANASDVRTALRFAREQTCRSPSSRPARRRAASPTAGCC